MRKGKPSGRVVRDEERGESLDHHPLPLTTDLSPASRKKVGKVVVLMTKVFNDEIIEAACEKEFGIPENEVKAVIEAARAELIKATDYHIREEFGRMILILRDRLTSCIKIKDDKTALGYAKELTKLLGLYNKEQQNKESPESEELSLIQQQILPFVPIAKENTPVAELVRLLLIAHIALIRSKDASAPTRQTPAGDGGKKLSGVTRKTRDIPAPADPRPSKKK